MIAVDYVCTGIIKIIIKLLFTMERCHDMNLLRIFLVVAMTANFPVEIHSFTPWTPVAPIQSHISTMPLFVGATDMTLTEGLQKFVKKMNVVMTRDFFESSPSLKTLYSNCVKLVEVKESLIPGAGLGLLAKKNIKAGTIVSFYPAHALGAETGEDDCTSTFSFLDSDQEYFQDNPSNASCYLHCTDQALFKRSSILLDIAQGLEDVPLYLDCNPNRPIVPGWVSQFINDGATVDSNSEKGVLDYYIATKSKKNCVHIPWGPSPIMVTVTTKKVKKGEELLTSYGSTYWLGVLLDIRGEEGVGITAEIQKEIKDTATDLLKSMQTVSVMYENQVLSLGAEFSKI